MWCPECEEKVNRREVVENENRCPMCGHQFRHKRDNYSEDDDDDYGEIDFDDKY